MPLHRQRVKVRFDACATFLLSRSSRPVQEQATGAAADAHRRLDQPTAAWINPPPEEKTPTSDPVARTLN
jgi:hypothetical protein